MAKKPNGKPEWPANKVELWPLAKIKPYDRNPRTHPDSQIKFIADSMLVDGVTAPMLVDEDGVIIAGHGRRLAALRNGFTDYPVVIARGWTEPQKRAVRIKDNSYGLLSAWDVGLIRAEMGDLQLVGYDTALLGFEPTELSGFGIGVQEAAFPELTSTDRPQFQQMTFTLHDSQVEIVKAALTRAKAAGPFSEPNENSNGNALARICRAYKPEANQDSAYKPLRRKRGGKASPLQRKSRTK